MASCYIVSEIRQLSSTITLRTKKRFCSRLEDIYIAILKSGSLSAYSPIQSCKTIYAEVLWYTISEVLAVMSVVLLGMLELT